MVTRNQMETARQSIAAHLRSVAEWRRWRAEDYNRDPRNLVSAAGLDELALFVLDLNDADPRLVQLERVACVMGQFQPGQQTNYAIGRFRFHTQDSECAGFLDHLVELALLDQNEQGRFGGANLPPGDDPWS